MPNQFIAHADAPRTFSSKKGATAAIKRDLKKHDESHGDVLFETGFEVHQSGDAYGVVIFCDLTPTTAQKLVGPELHGYVIEPQLKDETVKEKPVNVRDGEAAHKDDYPATKKATRRKGQVAVDPTCFSLVACRVGSKQQAIIDMLSRGNVWDQKYMMLEQTSKSNAEPMRVHCGWFSLVGGVTLGELRTVCVKKDGVTPWDDNSIRSALYYDLKDKGYGTSTQFIDNEPTYSLVLPLGYDAPLPPKESKS